MIGTVFPLNLCIGCLALAQICTKPVSDLPQFYFAGKLVRSGQISRLYDTSAYRPLVAELGTADRNATNGWYYFNRPAFEAPLFIPLSLVSYEAAKILARVINIFLVVILVWKLPQWFHVPNESRLYLPVYLPFLVSVAFGQDTLLLTLIVSAGLYLALKGRDLPAGVVLALAVFKPHLIFLLPFAFAASRRWKLLGSFLITGSMLGIISLALVGVQGVHEWILLLRAPSTDIGPQVMGNIRALAIHLGKPAAIAATFAGLGSFAFILKRGSFSEKFAAAIIMGLLLSPHTYPQDYSLLPIAGMVAFSFPVLYAALLPWPYFYPSVGKDMLPFIFLSLAGLIALSYRAWQRHADDALAGTALHRSSTAGDQDPRSQMVLGAPTAVARKG